jgi:hypothetical protein
MVMQWPSDLLPKKTRVESREQERLKDSNTPLPGMYIVATIIIILFLIVAILGVNVFHFW